MIDPRRLLAAACLSFLLAAPIGAEPSKPAYLHYLQGVLFEQQGNYAQAMKEYESVVVLDPKASYVYYQQAELALELGQLDKALESAQKALELDGPTARGYRLLGNVQWARGDQDAARDAFERALEVDPAFAEALLALANLTAPTDPEAAKGYYRRYLEADPDRAPEAHYQLALIEERQGNSEEAAAHLKEALNAEPDFLQARYSLAQLYEVRQDTAAALAEYLEIAKRELNNPSLLVRIGQMHSMLGAEEEAEADFRRALALQPSHPGACFHLALRAEERGEFAAAADLLRASAHFPSDPKLHLRLSYYLTQMGDLGEAVKVLEAARAKWPKEAEIAYFLALGYDGQGKPAQSLPLLEEVVREEPESRDPRFHLGAALEKLGRIEDAVREFRALLEKHPEDAQALNYLGYSLADRGRDLEEAHVLISKAVALEPDNGAFLDSLGWVHFKLGRSTQALGEIGLALLVLPADGTIWEHLGDVYAVVKDTWPAWEAWKTSLLLEPSDRGVAAKVKTLEERLPAEELGDRLLGHLGRTHGSVRGLFGTCTVTGKVAGKEFSLNGLLHFERQGESSGMVRIQMLGPFFIPIWRAAIGPDDAFEMDAMKMQGLDEAGFAQAVASSMRFLRDYWSGALFAGPGLVRRGWAKSWVDTPKDRLFLSANQVYVQSAESKVSGRAVRFKDFDAAKLHALPKVFEFDGPGFTARIEIKPASTTFLQDAPAP